MYTILLQDGTVGTSDTLPIIGDSVTIQLGDENGLPIAVTGIVAEVLQD